MKVNTSELTNAALDWAVAKCEGHPNISDAHPDGGVRVISGQRFNPSLLWGDGGPIIERESIAIGKGWEQWAAYKGCDTDEGMLGPTPLIAAMRCYVASKLGDVVDVPDELWPSS